MIHTSLTSQVISDPHLSPPPPPPLPPENISIMSNSVHTNTVMDDVMMAFSTFSATPTNAAHTTASHLSYTYCTMSNDKDEDNSKMTPPPLPMCLKAKPIVNIVAVEMGSIDACPSHQNVLRLICLSSLW